MRVKVGLSYIPEANLSVVDAHSDYGFALTHLVLESLPYASHYRTKPSVFLDNSFHELGDSATIEDILQAARLIQPFTVVAPDWIGDHERTVEAVKDFLPKLRDIASWPIHLAAAVTGHTAEDMVACFKAYCDMRPHAPTILCLPYKCNRVGFLENLTRMSAGRDAPGFHWHLFGYHDWLEFEACLSHLKRLGAPGITLDTAKPLTYAYDGIDFTRETRSGEARRPVFKMTLPIEDQNGAVRNLLTLKHWIREWVKAEAAADARARGEARIIMPKETSGGNGSPEPGVIFS